MNKDKLRKLVEQATEIYYKSYSVVDNQIFAELIIKECLEQIEDLYHYDGQSDTWDNTLEAVKTNIKFHFGMEEKE